MKNCRIYNGCSQTYTHTLVTEVFKAKLKLCTISKLTWNIVANYNFLGQSTQNALSVPATFDLTHKLHIYRKMNICTAEIT